LINLLIRGIYIQQFYWQPRTGEPGL